MRTVHPEEPRVPRHPTVAEEKRAEHGAHKAEHHHPSDRMIVQLMELRGRVMALEPHPVPATYLAELIDLMLGHDAEDPPVVGTSRAHRHHPHSHVHEAMKRHHEAKKAEAEAKVHEAEVADQSKDATETEAPHAEAKSGE